LARHDELLVAGPREAPTPETAEERTAAPTRAIVSGSILSAAMIVGFHALGFIPGYGPMFLFLGAVVWLGLTVHRLVVRAARQGRTTSPLRGLVLVLAAITLAALVLATLSGFQAGDWIVVVVPAGVLAVIWMTDRLLSRKWTAATHTGV
jgi:hypothetical protein